MAKEINDLRKALRSYRFEIGLLQKIPCSKEENKKYAKIIQEGGNLPEGVFAYVYANSNEPSTTEFYTVYDPNLTKEEVAEYLTYKQLTLLTTIKNSLLFFVVLTVLGMLFTLSTLGSTR